MAWRIQICLNLYVAKWNFFFLQIALTGVTFLPTDESAPSKQELLVASKFCDFH